MPICFAHADARGFVYGPTLKQVYAMIRRAYGIRPQRINALQFAGGEPTLADTFLPACRYAKKLGFRVVHAATNGLRFADLDFCCAAKEAGLDGLDDDIYRQTRGCPLLETKMKVIESCRKAGLWIVFVPTIVKGINDRELGRIMHLAIENADIMHGIAFQPVAFTGRIDHEERIRYRYTLADMAHDLEEQTGLVSARDDFYHLSALYPLTTFFSMTIPKNGKVYLNLTSHAHCGLGTYVLVDRERGIEGTVPVFRLFDFENMLIEIHNLNRELLNARNSRYSVKALRHGLSILQRNFRKDNSLGIGFLSFMTALMGMMGRGRQYHYHSRWKFLLIGGMHFQDAYNYEIERVKRCVIIYATPAGGDGSDVRFYPFCAYNSGPGFRDKVERLFSQPMKEN